MVNIILLIYNLIIIGIFAVLSYRLNNPWVNMLSLLFIMSKIDYDYTIDEE